MHHTGCCIACCAAAAGVACVQVLHDKSYHQAARELSAVLQTQARQRHPYAAAADEVELAVYKRLLKQQHHSSLHQPHAKAARKSMHFQAAAGEGAAVNEPQQVEL